MALKSTSPRARKLEVWRFNWSLLTGYQRRLIIAAVACVAVLLALGIADAAASRGRVHRGVVAGGVALGGLTPEEALVRLRAAAAPLAADPATALVLERRIVVWPQQVAFAVDEKATVERSYRVGRRGAPLGAVIDRVRGWLGTLRVEPVVRYDARRLDLRVAAVARAVDRAPADGKVIDIDGNPAAMPATEGIRVERAAARRALLAAFVSRTDRSFALPVVTTAPRVGTDAARAAAAQLDIAIATPVTLSYGSRRWVVKGPIIRRWMQITPRATSSELDAPLVLDVYPDPERVRATIARITAPIVKPAVDARFEVDGATVKVVPSKTGLAVDTKAAFDLIARRLTETAPARQVALSMHAVQPKLTSAAAKEMGIRRRLSTYTTDYSSSNAPRVNNIQLLARALDNTLVGPGDEFSFNRTIGPRTAAKGYQEAPVIVNGKLVPGLGGGICQVGTTIFNTVFFSGLPVVERTNHSFYISHYPDGRDATVSWDGPDFRFRNETASWLLVKTWASSDSITISLYGSPVGYEVTFKTSAWTNRTPYPVSEVPDPTLEKGTKIVEDVGVEGHDVTVTRTVKKAGKVVREDSFSSHYRPKEQVVRAGTKAPPPPPKPKPKPKPKPPVPTPPTTPTGGETGTAGGR